MAAEAQEPTKITPALLQEMLRYYNLSRQEFIDTYKLQPLVYVPEMPHSAKTSFVIVYTVIFVMALAGNSLVVYIIVKKRAVQTATDIFICSLAVSDLLITFFCVPFTLLQNISSEWFGGESYCPGHRDPRAGRRRGDVAALYSWENRQKRTATHLVLSENSLEPFLFLFLFLFT